MATYTKAKLASSTSGRRIKVVATATAGTAIHTTSTDAATIFHEVTLVIHNTHTAAVTVTLEWGGVTSPDDLVKFTLAPNETVYHTDQLVGDGSGLAIKAFAGTANVVTIGGWVNKTDQT